MFETVICVCAQSCGLGARMSCRFLGEVRVGFLRTLEVGFYFFLSDSGVRLNHLLHRTSKLGSLQIPLKLLWKQRILAGYHDFHW